MVFCVTWLYSLMAKALESMVEHDGKAVYEKYRIYDWLDDIRKMGNEQSFQYRDRKKEKSDW